jgi:hypothetical protein
LPLMVSMWEPTSGIYLDRMTLSFSTGITVSPFPRRVQG